MATNPNLKERLEQAEVIEPIQLKATYPTNFVMTGKGLTFSVEKENGDVDMRLVTGPFEVIAQTRDRNSQSWGVLLRWRDDDGNEHQLAVARAWLAGDGREVRQAMLDGGLYVAPGAKERNALQSFLATVKINRRSRAVTRIGWQDDAYALPDRTIEAGGGDLVVYQGAAAIDHEFRANGTLGGWQREVAAMGAGNSRLAIAICAGFTGPLLAAAGAEGGGLHLRGASSIGKSTALLAGASIWGPPSFVRQWRATTNGLEGVAELANDCLLVLDELAQLDPRDAGIVAYMLANGMGKARAGQTGEARAARRWLTFFLSSGEISLADHARADGRGRRSPAGQEVRILDVEADAGKGLGLFDTLHGYANGDTLARTIKEGVTTHHGVAGPEFVRRLLGNLDDIAADVRTGIDLFASNHCPEDANGQVHRVCRRFGLVAMAGETAIRLDILPWEMGEALKQVGAVFNSWLACRGGAGAAEDRAALEQVSAFLTAHGNSRFQQVTEATAIIHNLAGFKRETKTGTVEYLIPPATWRSEVCAGINPKAAAELLLRMGYLEADSAGKASHSVTIPGHGKARFYIIKQSIFGGEDE